MFDITKVKIGDYIETWDGRVGYVTKLGVLGKNTNTQKFFTLPFCWESVKGDKYCVTEKIATNSNYGATFKQIGAYKFDETKSKMSKVTINGLSYDSALCELTNAVNRIVECLNNRGD